MHFILLDVSFYLVDCPLHVGNFLCDTCYPVQKCNSLYFDGHNMC